MPRSRNSRLLLGAAAWACFGAAIALTPSGVRSQLEPRSAPILAGASLHAEPEVTPVAPAGDAFEPRAAVDDQVRNLPAHPANLPPLPAGTTLLPVVKPQPAAHVTAIVTGSHPTAIIETNGETRLVTVGDPLDGSTVGAIDDDGIRLENGRTIVLEPATGTP